MMIVAEGLEQTFLSAGRPLPVLKDINLAVAAQGFVAIVGPSGSGKTTLLGLLAGLDRPSAGSVTLDGQNLNGLSEDQRARFRAEKVGFVFQTFQLIPTLTALENVLVPIELRGGMGNGAAAIERRAARLLERVGLGDRTHHYPAQLSGGEQQRVALARAFAGEPKILFADEPTGNLDAALSDEILDLFLDFHNHGVTVLIATHDWRLINRARKRVLELNHAELVRDSGAAA